MTPLLQYLTYYLPRNKVCLPAVVASEFMSECVEAAFTVSGCHTLYFTCAEGSLTIRVVTRFMKARWDSLTSSARYQPVRSTGPEGLFSKSSDQHETSVSSSLPPASQVPQTGQVTRPCVRWHRLGSILSSFRSIEYRDTYKLQQHSLFLVSDLLKISTFAQAVTTTVQWI